ncbi:hypothetical protein B0G77_3903 [Paraburkholderia sp. BL10I2N1]|nr:hypothetical protein B0G77_3903 [Paraburkholderia sp. BL10I2N1]
MSHMDPRMAGLAYVSILFLHPFIQFTKTTRKPAWNIETELDNWMEHFSEFVQFPPDKA